MPERIVAIVTPEEVVARKLAATLRQQQPLADFRITYFPAEHFLDFEDETISPETCLCFIDATLILSPTVWGWIGI